MTIKVTHVVRQYAPSVGGMEDVVQNIARHQLQQHGQIPRIVTLDRLFTHPKQIFPASDNVDGIAVVRVPYKGSSRYPIAPAVLAHLADADVVHVHGIDFFYDYLAWTKWWHRRPLVASTHGGFFHTEFASTLKNVYFKTVTRASSLAYDRIVGTSNNDGDMFRPIVSGNKLRVIENGVNVEKYSGKAAFNQLPVAIYFGRWSINKGLAETIALFKQLVMQDSSWQLIIAGREYDISNDDLLKLIGQHQLDANVRVIPNPSEQQLAELIGQASYYVCLSRHEGFGIAPIEGMSAGLVPLLSDIPPFRNLVTQSGLGLLIDVADLSDAATKISELYRRGALDHALQRQAVQQFVTRYSWAGIADQYVDIYKELATLRTHDA
ncbi:MAG: alpha-1,3-mannosyltransferase [Candidatus Azotimanducaceae bacterium]|jgi:alpha-1,3-mannosyltransferase